MAIHHQTHPEYVEDCERCRWLSVRLSAEATPTQRQEALQGLRADKALEQDRDAYKRLRAQGYQPPRLQDAADLERKAQIAEHIESGHLDWQADDVRRAEDVLGHKVTEAHPEGWAPESFEVAG